MYNLYFIQHFDFILLHFRKALETLLNYMLTQDHVAFNLVKHIVPRLCQIKDYSESLVIQMAETISEIREPITTVEKDISEDMRRQNDVKVKIHCLLLQACSVTEELSNVLPPLILPSVVSIKWGNSGCDQYFDNGARFSYI